jgi:hypothetical protein
LTAWRARGVWLVALPAALLALIAGGAPVAAADVTFEPPTAVAEFGQPLSFRTTLRTDEPPLRVELVSRLPTSEVSTVEQADVVELGDGSFEATVTGDGHVHPNTTLDYHFRAVTAEGDVDGPAARVTVVDQRFAWRVLDGRRVRVHWYEGDEAFARRAQAIGQRAIERASDLLGVTLDDPVDFFVYASTEPFREALGPAARENVGGQANPALATFFGLIEPSEIDSSWVDVLVAHELTHLVFAEAADNPYRRTPRWLDEGVAVHLSQGYDAADRAIVEEAAAAGRLLPLRALGGLFPTSRDQFALAYAESVAAVDLFIATYGEDRLVALIRSYATGVTDEEAFRDATGSGLAAFDEAFMSRYGAVVPEPLGPRPAPPGPLPADWTVAGGPAPGASPEGTDVTSSAAVSQPAASRPPSAGSPTHASRPDDGGASVTTGNGTEGSGTAAVVAVAGIVVVGLALVLAARSRRGA